MSQSWAEYISPLKQKLSTPSLQGLEGALLRAEAEIDLIGSLTPENFSTEVQRLTRQLEEGICSLPSFSYRRSPGQRERLVAVALCLHQAQAFISEGWTGRSDPWWDCLRQLLQRRVTELLLELELVKARGTSRLSELALRRYRMSLEELTEADELAGDWLRVELEGPGQSAQLIDASQKFSLASQLNARVIKYSLELRIVEMPLASIAAQAGDCIYVQKGARTSEREAERIWVHEVNAHLLPRRMARRNGPPFAIGTAGCAADEEGRALLLESRVDGLGRERRRNLAIRHRLARALRDDLSPPAESATKMALSLVEQGLAPAQVAPHLARVLRGGGLGREIIYLPSFLRVSRALTKEPELERWLEQGRISISGARTLSGLVGNLVPR